MKTNFCVILCFASVALPHCLEFVPPIGFFAVEQIRDLFLLDHFSEDFSESFFSAFMDFCMNCFHPVFQMLNLLFKAPFRYWNL